jgi:hypothetical protein
VTWTSDSTVVSILPDGEATTAGVPGSAHITACSGICQITTVTVQ